MRIMSMKHVIGLGGMFLKLRDPQCLYERYRKHLGIESAPGGSGRCGAIVSIPEVPGSASSQFFLALPTTSAPGRRHS